MEAIEISARGVAKEVLTSGGAGGAGRLRGKWRQAGWLRLWGSRWLQGVTNMVEYT